MHFVPGMTGPCQLAGQPWLSVEEAIRRDHAYLRSWGPLRDLGLVLRTLGRALSGRIRPAAGPGPDVAPPALALPDPSSVGTDLRSPVPAAASAGPVPTVGPRIGAGVGVGVGR
jgi:hypothetical protein